MKGDVGAGVRGEVIPPPLLLCTGVGNGCATTGSEANVGEGIAAEPPPLFDVDKGSEDVGGGGGGGAAGTIEEPPPLLDVLGRPVGPAGDTGNVDIPAPRFTNCGVAGVVAAGVEGATGKPLDPPIKLILSNPVVH